MSKPRKTRMKRIDSMVTDVIQEANYLHQLMDAVGVGEDLSEGEEPVDDDTFIDMPPEVRGRVVSIIFDWRLINGGWIDMGVGETDSHIL